MAAQLKIQVFERPKYSLGAAQLQIPHQGVISGLRCGGLERSLFLCVCDKGSVWLGDKSGRILGQMSLVVKLLLIMDGLWLFQFS